MTIHQSQVTIVRFPDVLETWIIKEMDSGEKQGGLTDNLETLGFSVHVCDSMELFVSGNFYKLVISSGSTSRSIVGNDHIKVEALETGKSLNISTSL